MEMPQKKRTKDKIMTAAWKLFLSQGYEDTTISQIIAASATSRSAFIIIFMEKKTYSLPLHTHTIQAMTYGIIIVIMNYTQSTN